MFESAYAFVQANALLTVVYVCLLIATTAAVNSLATNLAKWRLQREDLELFTAE